MQSNLAEIINMLELKSVFAGYEDKRVLSGVSLKVGDSEIIGLVGPNGSGKSTVLKSIFGLVRVDNGGIVYKGSAIQNRKPFLNVEAGICYIPQGSKVFDKLTVQENLEMGGVLLKDRKQLLQRLDTMYEKFPKLKTYRNTPAGRLSGGERQMVGFCIGLIMNPDFLLIDEPSIGLAPALVNTTMETISSIRSNFHTSVLIVEQNVRALLKIVDRIYLLKLGEIVYEENTITADTEKNLRELFLK
jgi:ABC-type branched-subunit amino acid transport system ATPase component